MTIEELLLSKISNNWLKGKAGEYYRFSKKEGYTYFFHTVYRASHNDHYEATRSGETMSYNEFKDLEFVEDDRIIRRLDIITAKLELVEEGMSFETTFKG